MGATEKNGDSVNLPYLSCGLSSGNLEVSSGQEDDHTAVRYIPKSESETPNWKQ